MSRRKWIPPQVREWVHELVTPGGCWISVSLVEKLNQMAPVFADEKGGISSGWALGMALTSMANKAGATKAELLFEGQTSKGVPIGDWRVTVERIAAPDKAREGDSETCN